LLGDTAGTIADTNVLCALAIHWNVTITLVG